MHRRNRVGGFARLANPQHHRARPDVGLAIAHFAGDLDFHHEVGQALEHIPGIQPRVVTRATRHNHQMLRLFQAVEHFIQAPEMRNALPANEPAAQGVGNRVGLLKNFFEHVMRKAVAFDRIGLPFNPFRLARDRLVGQRINDVLMRPNGHDVIVFQIHHLVREAQERGDIACQEHFVLPDAEHHRRATPRRHQLMRMIRVHHHQPVRAGHLAQGALDRLAQIARVLVFDQVGDHFRIGFRAEAVAPGTQLLA